MDNEQKHIARLIFKNLIYEKEGQSFEDLFVKVMEKIDDGFQPVKAYGNIGDKKNDGFNKKSGTYYQVYAPENIQNQKTIANAMAKLEKDLKGLFSNWNNLIEIKKFYFVINDKFKGVPAPIHEKMAELSKKDEYHAVDIDLFRAKDLLEKFILLEEMDMQDIIGFIPDTDISLIEIGELKETIQYLMEMEIPMNFNDNLVVPDFNEKIAFNKLSSIVEQQLTTGSFQEGALIEYFNENPGINGILQRRFQLLYDESKREIADNIKGYADERFYYILNKASSKHVKPVMDSVLVLMAHYFQSCDIFEEPKNE